MPQGLLRLVGQQVLLRDVGDVLAFRVLGEEMVEGLVLPRADFLGDRQPPLLGIGEYRVDVENDPAEWEDPVPDHVSDAELRLLLHDSPPLTGLSKFRRARQVNRRPAARLRGGNGGAGPG
jgi:hypothetical protein